MVCIFFLYFYISGELSYDQFHADKDKIYRVIRTSEINGDPYRIGVTSGPFGPALLQDYEGTVRSMCRVLPDNGLVTVGENRFTDDEIIYADANFFRFFSFPLVSGSPEALIDLPNQAVISQSLAQKYFRHEDPIGKTFTIDLDNSFIVTGVFEDLGSKKSHLDFDMVVSLEFYTSASWFDGWWNNGLITYLKIDTPEAAMALESKLGDFMDKYFDSKNSTFKIGLTLEPLSETYFNNQTRYDWVLHGDWNTIKILVMVGLAILIIASFNFINLSIAFSFRRAKEVGIRKVLGVDRLRLIFQFLSESAMILFFAFALSIGLSQLFLSSLNNWYDLDVSFYWADYQVWFFLGTLFLVILILSALYPAILMSSFKPLKVLNRRVSINGDGFGLRRVLVVLQFAISIFMIATTLFITTQVDYLRNKEIGFEKEAILMVDNYNADIRGNMDSFKKELLANANISSVSSMTGEPGGFHDATIVDIQGVTEELRVRTVFTDENYLKTLGIKIAAGSDFEEHMANTEEAEIIFNEQVLKELNLTAEEIVNKPVTIPSWEVKGCYFFVENWLGSFAYRIDILNHWDLFLLGTAITILVALATVVIRSKVELCSSYFWKMSNASIRIVVLLATISLAAIIVTQVYLVNQAVSSREQQFDHSVQMALRNVVESVCEVTGVDVPTEDPIDRISSNYFVVRTNNKIDIEALEYHLKAELTKREVNQDFEYGVYDCQSDQMVYGDLVSLGTIDADASSKPIPTLKDYDYYFGLYFPSKRANLIMGLDWWKFTSAITILVIIFFSYALFIILRQKRLSVIQRDFVNNVTHEFKTPLATLKVASEVLKEGGTDTDRISRYSDIILKECERLEGHVNQLLKSALVEDRKRMDLQSLDLSLLTKKVVSRFVDPGKNIKVNIEQGVHIRAEAYFLENAIFNLVDNAVKYGGDEILIKDDPNLGFVTKDSLEVGGFKVTWYQDGGEVSYEDLEDFDLCILDIMLPREDGFTIASKIRVRDEFIPIIFLTARGMEEDRLKGFEIGGDDYVVKPFSIKELIYRIEVFVRRSKDQARDGQKSNIESIGRYAFDRSNLTLSIGDLNQTLTRWIIIMMTLAVLGLIAFQWYWVDTVIVANEDRFRKDVFAALEEVAKKVERQEILYMVNQKSLRPTIRPVNPNNPLGGGGSAGQYYYEMQGEIDSADINFYFSIDAAGQVRFSSSVSSFGQAGPPMSPVDPVQKGQIESQLQRVNNKSEMVVNLLEDLMMPRRLSARINGVIIDSLLRIELQEKGIDLPYNFGVIKPNEGRFVSINDPSMSEELSHSEYKAYLFPNDFVGDPSLLSVHFPGETEFMAGKMWFTIGSSGGLILIILFCFGYAVNTIVKQKHISEMKNDFINNMTHELKTPIATIGLAVEALRDKELQTIPEMRDRYLGMVGEENKRLGTQVEKVLQMALIDKRELKFNMEHLDLHDLVNQASKKIALQVENSDGSLTTSLIASETWIKADATHMLNVIINLLDNAIKYSEDVNTDIPIVFLTAKSMKQDVIQGFEIGADDYITKPFSMEELLLRLNAILKRTGQSEFKEFPNKFEIGSLTYFYDENKLITSEGEIKLTTKENELLRVFLEHLNETVNRSYALKKIWKDDTYFNARSMDVYIAKLRKYLKVEPTLKIEHGVKRVHLVDLDGARKGAIVNHGALELITGHTKLKVNYAGGIHTDGDVTLAFEYGAESITAATIAAYNSDLFSSWIMSYGRERIALGADCLDRMIKVGGWQRSTRINIMDHVAYFYNRGLKYVKTTDINRDGVLAGPAFDLYRELINEFPGLCIFASGGIRNMDDIQELEDLGLYGVIFGRAFYEGAITLKEIEQFNSKSTANS
ncbi:hisA [Symbiodinium microadriaticum]|nr:hisA [Symbiodinium microadriaticum]